MKLYRLKTQRFHTKLFCQKPIPCKYSSSNSVDDLLTELQKEFEDVWSCPNEIGVNLKNCQSIIINRLGKLKKSHKFFIDDHKTDSGNSLTLLDIQRGDKLNFEKRRSSHERCSIKEVALRNFTEFTGKQLCQSVFLNKDECHKISKIPN